MRQFCPFCQDRFGADALEATVLVGTGCSTKFGAITDVVELFSLKRIFVVGGG